MLDCIITGGLVVDGTGAAARHLDVGIRDGRIVSLGAPGETKESAARTINAIGLVVAPGFIDVHTHLDAQVFWDSACTPIALHGVTTVIGGNCGFSIAPLEDHAAHYLMTMLARVEGIPLESLETGVPWNWRSFGEYLDAVEHARPVVNAGFLVGHSALRRVVMGEDAIGGRASADQIAVMCGLLRDALAAGGFGLSSSWSRNHCDGKGDPVPSRSAAREEMLELAATAGEFAGTQLQVAPDTGAFDDDVVELMTTMSVRSRRPINWNVFVPQAARRRQNEMQLAASAEAAKASARIWALAYPGVIRSRFTFQHGSVLLDPLPGFSKLMSVPAAERKQRLADPHVRAELEEQSRPPAGVRPTGVANWAALTVVETCTNETAQYEGLTIGEIAARRGQQPFDALMDVVLADDLGTGLVPQAPGDDDESWQMRVDAWRDDRVVLGASDAGAHLDLITTYDWAPTLLAENRARRVFSLEAAVHRLTGVQAAAYGLVDRGIIAEGKVADLVLFDPEVIAPGKQTWVDDLPGGAGRLFEDAVGISSVIVNGIEVVQDGVYTGAAPGSVLRSGRDTITVPMA